MKGLIVPSGGKLSNQLILIIRMLLQKDMSEKISDMSEALSYSFSLTTEMD